jgi:Mrp family chromosome partitioning ATPase
MSVPQAEGGDDGQAVSQIAARILAIAAHRARGIRVLATSLTASTEASCLMLDLARCLAQHGRAIAIGLDTESLIEPSSQPAALLPGEGAHAHPALSELICGTASFSEVIGRDPASRLHLLPIGHAGDVPLHEFEPVLDALGATYDFLLMLAPPAFDYETARMLASATDLAVLAVQAGQGGAASEATRRLIEGGAREVLLIGLSPSDQPSLGRDAA